MMQNLGAFVRQFERQHDQHSPLSSYAVTVGATLASAYVTGHVTLPPSSLSSKWNPVEGSPTSDKELGWAVVLFCTLAVTSFTSSPSTTNNKNNTGELLWPAIHKGISQSAATILLANTTAQAGAEGTATAAPAIYAEKAAMVARGLLLLENGCKLKQISGLGNGDLVINPKTQQLMPPPPTIESLLHDGIQFIKWQIRLLLSTETHTSITYNNDKRFTGTYAFLISQLKILYHAYPSSNAVSNVMDELLKNSFEELDLLMTDDTNSSSEEGDTKKVLLVGLIYGACSCGAVPGKESLYIPFCRLLMRTGLVTSGEGQPKVYVKSSRSIIQYSRWAAISYILPKILETAAPDELVTLIDDLIKEGIAASSITPSDAIKPLFDCIIMSSRQWLCASTKYNTTEKVERIYLETLTKIITVLLSLIKQSTRSRESAYMLNDFCEVIFQSKLLQEEYDRILEQDQKGNTSSPSSSITPIRDAFRKLIKMAGRHRPHVNRAVLCRITVAWRGDHRDNNTTINKEGLSAIPYRDDIVKLIIHKEAKKDESASNQSEEIVPASGSDVTEIPANTNYLSITRAFLLVFFHQLPASHALHPTVKKELLHFIILALLKEATPEKGTHPKLVMKGTPTYCMKIRAWQALCVMSRFVTTEIAQDACRAVFDGLGDLLHCQIRYFIENFTIQCSMMHPEIFGDKFMNDVSRADLSLQHISSLMIMGGNFIVGKYQLEYFTDNKERLNRVLAGVIPWLSSTQGFSRAIAQLMVYQLIPRVIDVSSSTASLQDSAWYLKSTYNFLDTNREMKRLRDKQIKFFDRYDCETISTPEGVFSIKVDEAEEADPVHLIDAMKESLRHTYDEAHGSDAPAWKQIEDMMTNSTDGDVLSSSSNSDNNNSSTTLSSTVQRKIIPLDSLNLALENLREQRTTNAKGTNKQELIICASLVDKIPNLAGLARTSEIFAAKSLVIPDLSVTKMDNFKSISVGAADWINIEEVKIEVGSNHQPSVVQYEPNDYSSFNQDLF